MLLYIYELGLIIEYLTPACPAKWMIIFILFKPEVHRTISSFSLSNFKMVKTKASKKDKGINFVKIFGIFNNE